MFGEMPSFYNMLKWGNESNHNLGLPKIWNSNVKTNHEYLCSLNGKVTSAREIQKHTGKAAILVGASPILNNTYEHLQTIDRDKFIIIATNSSAKFLVDHNIAPDYIFLIDGQKGKWTLDIGEEKLASTLIVSPFAEPLNGLIDFWLFNFTPLGFFGLRNDNPKNPVFVLENRGISQR